MSVPRRSPQPLPPPNDNYIPPSSSSYPLARPVAQPQIDIRAPVAQDFTGYISDRSLDNSDVYINGDTTFENQNRLIQPNVRPQNYESSQDPTMQNLTAADSRSGKPESKFDELYKKVLQDAEGALTNARGDTAERVVEKPQQMHAGAAGDPAARVKHDKDGGTNSDHSHHSQRSQRSSRSHQGQQQQQPRSSVTPRSGESGSKNQVHSSLESSPGKSFDLSNTQDQHYTESFEKSQSDVSLDIEEVLELRAPSDDEKWQTVF